MCVLYRYCTVAIKVFGCAKSAGGLKLCEWTETMNEWMEDMREDPTLGSKVRVSKAKQVSRCGGVVGGKSWQKKLSTTHSARKED